MLHINAMQRTFVDRQQGASLVETMVSLLILGVGLLGVLSLQVNGSTSNQRAVFVTEAQVLAQDMADRIRAFGDDGLGARGGQYSDADTGLNSSAAYTDKCLTSCDVGETVANDLSEWEFVIDESSLPSGRGKVFFDDAINQYTIRIMWDQDRTGANLAIPDDESCNGDKATSKGAGGYLTCYDILVSTYRD